MLGLESNYKIVSKQNLVIQCHAGVLELNNYIHFASNLHNDPLYSPNLNHLINIKNVLIKASIDDLKEYVSFSENNFKKPRTRRIAIVTETPNQVALSTLFKMLQKNMSQEVEIFSTIEKAIDWLQVDSNHADIKIILDKLQEKI